MVDEEGYDSLFGTEYELIEELNPLVVDGIQEDVVDEVIAETDILDDELYYKEITQLLA